MSVCHLCKKPLVTTLDPNSTYQFDNNLWIGFFGGYGMFIESPDFLDPSESKPAEIINGASYEVCLCHDCAHALCEREPWLDDLLLPERSHSHTVNYLKQNPNHIGWDNNPKESKCGQENDIDNH